MKRWMFIAAAALLTLGGLAFFSAPAMARDFHPRQAHVATRWRGEARHHAYAKHVARARHDRAHRHAAHRR